MQVYNEARRRYFETISMDGDQFAELAKQYKSLEQDIKTTLSQEYKGGFESARDLFKFYSQIII